MLASHRCLRGEPTDAQTVDKYIETYVNNVYDNNRNNFRYALIAGREYVKSMIHVLDMKHPLCVLTKTEFDDIVSNNVTVRDFIPLMIDFSLKKVRQTFFKVSRDDIGVNIAPHLKILKNDNLLCLSAVERNFLSITTEIDSTLRNDNMICLLGDSVPNSSNMVLLFLATYNKDVPKKSNLKKNASLFRQNRFNINGNGTSGNHFGSSGESYGIGFVPKYRQNKFGLTFGQYAEKKRKTDHVETYGKMNQVMLEYLHEAKTLPCSIISRIDEKMMVFNTATRRFLSSVFTDVTLEKLRKKDTGIEPFMSSQININVTTLIPHTELDVSSTLIYIPVQTTKNHEMEYGFEIKFNHFTSMTIKLIEGTTLLYSAYMVTHRQIKLNQTSPKSTPTETNMYINKSQASKSKEEFINISTYYSTRLYSHIKTSVQRFQEQQEFGKKVSNEKTKI